MGELARCADTRSLSTVQLQSFDDDASLAQISGIVDWVTEHSAEQFAMSDVCARVGHEREQVLALLSGAPPATPSPTS